MKLAILSLSLLISASSFSQIIINSVDLPQPGQEYYRSTSLTANINLTETGANHTWNYVDLQNDLKDTMVYDEVSQTPIVYQFLFNNPVIPQYYSTEARKSDDMDIGGMIQLTENYLYSKNSSTSWNEVGIGTTISGGPIPTQYSDIKTKLKLPLHFNDSNTDDFSYLMTVPTVGAIGQDGTLSYTVDGWGTLITPGGTFDVLRVKTEVNKSDTVFISLAGIGLRIPSSEVIYEWYAKSKGYPILTVKTQLGLITSVEFLDAPPLGVSNLNTSSNFNIYPNPVQNILHIESESSQIQVAIIDLSGQVVLEHELVSQKQINLEKLPKGVYFIQITDMEKTKILRFVKM